MGLKLTYSEFAKLEADLKEARARRAHFLTMRNQIGAKQEKARIRHLENKLKEALR